MFSAKNRIFRNRSRRYSTPSAQVIASLGPLKSSNQAIFNGSKLDIGTARGAKNGKCQNPRKSHKISLHTSFSNNETSQKIIKNLHCLALLFFFRTGYFFIAP